jgi:hypothetical protein
MSFKDEMKKINTVKAKSEKEIKRENLENAHKVLDEFLEKEFPHYEEYLLNLVKKDIETNLKSGKFKSKETKKGEIKIVNGEIYFCSDKYQDDARYSKPIYCPKIDDGKHKVAGYAIELYKLIAGVNCDYKGVGLNIDYSSYINKFIGIVNVKKRYLLRENFKRIFQKN